MFARKQKQGMKMSNKIRPIALGLLMALGMYGSANALSIYPIDRAEILAGTKFDLKVEFDGVTDLSKISLQVNGQDYRKVFPEATFIANEDGKPYSSLLLRGATVMQPGNYTVMASDGTVKKAVNWEVFNTPSKKAAKNVILFIGDGMAMAHRTAARHLSKGTVEGKALAKLAMDDMPHMSIIGNAGTDSVITDSANAAHAYVTGHKSCAKAVGVYCSRSANSLEHPRVETITEMAKRSKMSVGVITTATMADATPAAMVGHTGERTDYNSIARMFFEAKPDVMMGGGSVNFMPKSTLGSKRTDEVDYIDAFKKIGHQLVSTRQEMHEVAGQKNTKQLLGFFNPGNIDGVLDRKFLKKGTVEKFPDQPDLTEMLDASLKVLSRNQNGFVLMVESAAIDKYSHSLDWERGVYETIMLDNAVKQAKDWAAKRKDTLILVVADHAHAISLIGTVDDDKPGNDMREKVGLYGEAGYPNYPVPDAEGYPNRVDVSKRLRLVFGSHPDYYDLYRPYMDGGDGRPVLSGDLYVANPKYKDFPGAQLVPGNQARDRSRGTTGTVGSHSGDDLVLTATGPGAEKVRGYMENSEVFRVIVDALALKLSDKASKK